MAVGCSPAPVNPIGMGPIRQVVVACGRKQPAVGYQSGINLELIRRNGVVAPSEVGDRSYGVMIGLGVTGFDRVRSNEHRL